MRAGRRERMDELVLSVLPRGALIGAAFYSILATAELAIMRPSSWFALEDAALAALWIGIAIGARQRLIPPRGASAVVAATLALGGLRIVHEAVTLGMEPPALPLALVMVALGATVFSWPALLAALGVVLASALLAAGEEVGPWFVFPLVGSASVALLLHLVRSQLAHKLLALHEADEERNLALAEAHALAKLVRWDWSLASDTLTLSEGGRALYGMRPDEEPTREALRRRVHPEDLAHFDGIVARAAAGSDDSFELRHRIVRDDGVRHIAARGRIGRDSAGNVTTVWGISQDVTEATLMGETLRRQERLSSLGTLVAGVAHEINNPLAYMMGSVELTMLEVDDLLADPRISEEARERLREIRVRQEALARGANELASLSRSLRLVAKKGTAEREPVDVASLVEDVLRVAAARIPGTVAVNTLIDDRPTVLANRGELSQVLLNLVLNAADAMRNQPRGTLVVRIERHLENVHIHVCDTGRGITTEERANLFTPFFTTKPDGTGLGLSISHGIIEAHGGRIAFDSEPGRGTQFRVELPVPS